MVKHTSLLPIKYKNFWIHEQYISYYDVTFWERCLEIGKGEKFDEVRFHPDGLIKFLRPEGKCYEGYVKYCEFDQIEECKYEERQ